MTPSVRDSIRIEPLVKLEHLDAAVALQRVVWGYTDVEVDSRALMVVASRFAGQMLGAFDEEKLIGMALSFGVVSGSKPRLHSHRVGILPEYQNRGLGRMLKLAQREEALRQGIDTIQWTFDPLQQRNAYFNIELLGGIARRYIPNLYGVTTSPLHGGLPTDRLLIEWDLESPHVIQTLAGGRRDHPRVHPGDCRRIAVPDVAAARKEPQLQQRLREQFLELLGEGYVVTAFDKNAEHPSFLLEKE
jgi:predicted GNAT superfamily acetyltransferase